MSANQADHEIFKIHRQSRKEPVVTFKWQYIIQSTINHWSIGACLSYLGNSLILTFATKCDKKWHQIPSVLPKNSSFQGTADRHTQHSAMFHAKKFTWQWAIAGSQAHYCGQPLLILLNVWVHGFVWRHMNWKFIFPRAKPAEKKQPINTYKKKLIFSSLSLGHWCHQGSLGTWCHQGLICFLCFSFAMWFRRWTERPLQPTGTVSSFPADQAEKKRITRNRGN